MYIILHIHIRTVCVILLHGELDQYEKLQLFSTKTIPPQGRTTIVASDDYLLMSYAFAPHYTACEPLTPWHASGIDWLF